MGVAHTSRYLLPKKKRCNQPASYVSFATRRTVRRVVGGKEDECASSLEVLLRDCATDGNVIRETNTAVISSASAHLLTLGAEKKDGVIDSIQIK